MSNLQFPADSSGYPESSNATTALLLACASILFTILAPIALLMSFTEIRRIEEGRRSPDGLRTAKTARAIALVMTIIFGLGIIFGILLLVGGSWA